MTPEQLRDLARQSNRRALHCPLCGYPSTRLPPETNPHGLTQMCSGHTREKYNASHSQTLRILATIALELADKLEEK